MIARGYTLWAEGCQGHAYFTSYSMGGMDCIVCQALVGGRRVGSYWVGVDLHLAVYRTTHAEE